MQCEIAFLLPRGAGQDRPYDGGHRDQTLGSTWGSTRASAWVWLTTSFNSLLGLKNGIFFAGTSTRAPVLGLRPTRGLRWRVRKLPKPRISILSPDRRERTTLSKIVSTMISLSLRVSSARRETSSIRSALVMALFHLKYRQTSRTVLITARYRQAQSPLTLWVLPLWQRGCDRRSRHRRKPR